MDNFYKTLTSLASYNDGPDASSNSGAKRGNKSSTKRVDRERRARRVGANRPPDRHLRQQHLKYDIAFKLIVASQERRD